VRRVGLQEQQLRGDDRRNAVVDGPVDADDTLAQQAAENVEHALAAPAQARQSAHGVVSS
jgi:hypothetical protein